jgi:predicted MFS family arabinose efflux permease
MIMVPVTAQLIALIGWRYTFAAYGFATLGIILPVVWCFVVKRPEDIGLTPDNMPMGVESIEADEPVIPVAPGDQLIDHPGHLEWSTISALRDRNFWIINTTVGLCFFCMGAILTHLTAHLIDLGFSVTDEAPFIVATSAGVGAIGKLLFGWVADRIETRLAFWIAIIFLIAGTTLILHAETLPQFLRAAGVYGFGMGGIVPLYASLIGDAYGRANFGRIMGLMSLTMLPIHVGGLPFAGWVYDQYHNYDLAYKTFIILFAVSAFILAGLRKNGQNGNAPSIAPE